MENKEVDEINNEIKEMLESAEKMDEEHDRIPRIIIHNSKVEIIIIKKKTT